MRARGCLLAATDCCGRRRRQLAGSSLATGRWRGQYFKGNLHTHTLNSDGDSTPDDVVRWYREHDYNFVTLTDHNYLTSVDGLNALHGADEKFLVMKGEEVTDRFGNKPIHINGLAPVTFIKTTGGSSVVDMVQKMIDAIRAARRRAERQSSEFGWAISADELAQLQRTRLFEVFNGHPLVNNLGGGGVPGLEEVWDRMLSSGKMLYGIAVDDAHYFKRPEDKTAPRPGQGWVYVRVASARIARARRGARARRFLFVHRRRAAVGRTRRRPR